MKRLYIERVDLNKADDEYPMTVRIVLQMKDHVDGLLLEEAVAAAQTRYPYLCVKLGVELVSNVMTTVVSTMSIMTIHGHGKSLVAASRYACAVKKPTNI